MKLVGLISGGKDSIYNLIECVRNGHEIIALAHLVPPTTEQEEIDSYMYQTVGHNVIEAIAEAMQLPLTQRAINGKPKSQDEIYRITDNDEVEDLYQLLAEVKSKHPDVQGVASGAILSTYQRIRVENVSSRLGLTSYCYLWKRDQDELLGEMIESKMGAILIKVASMGLEPKKHLLKTIEEMYPTLKKLNQLYGVNICGEGGEYESLVLDCPLFKKKIILNETSLKIHSDDAFAQVAFISFSKFSLVEKSKDELEEDKEILKPAQRWKSLENNWSTMFSELNNDKSLSSVVSYVPNPICKLQKEGVDTHVDLSQTYSKLQLIESKSNGFFVISSYSPKFDTSKSTADCLEHILNEITQLLAENSLEMENLLYVNLHVPDLANEFQNVNRVYYRYFKENPAARACIQTTLPPGHKVMIDIIGNRRAKKNLHVQSISHWAPACIGPYSQATTVNQLLFMAGQIGMDPPTLALVPGGVEKELQQILINLVNIFESTKSTLASTLQVSVFLKDIKHSNLVNSYLKSVFSENKTMPLFLIVECEAMPKDSQVELLLLNELTPLNEDENGEPINRQQQIPDHFSIIKNFHDTKYGILTGYSSLATTPGRTTMFNFCLSLDDVNHQDNLISAQFLSEYYCSSLSDVLLTTISKIKPSNIIYLKIYHISKLFNIQKSISEKLKASLGNVPISFVVVNNLYIEENPHNIIINTEIMIANE